MIHLLMTIFILLVRKHIGLSKISLVLFVIAMLMYKLKLIFQMYFGIYVSCIRSLYKFGIINFFQKYRHILNANFLLDVMIIKYALYISLRNNKTATVL